MGVVRKFLGGGCKQPAGGLVDAVSLPVESRQISTYSFSYEIPKYKLTPL